MSELRGPKGDLLAFALGLASPLAGLALARVHPAAMPLVMTLAIYPVYLSDLESGEPWTAVRRVLLWALASSIAVVAATVLLGEGTVGPLILKGEEYRDEMLDWIRTGRGPEGDPSLFLVPKLIEIAVFTVLSLASAGFLGLFLGSYLLNYMNFYVGCLFLRAEDWAVPALFGWPIYAIIRVVGYTCLGTFLSIPLLRRLGRTELSQGEAAGLLKVALVCIALDFLLKATVANAIYQPILRGAIGV